MFQYFTTLCSYQLLTVDLFARVEKALALTPCKLLRKAYPQDPFRRLMKGAMDNNTLCTYIEEVTKRPRAESLLRLEAVGIDFAKFYAEFMK